MKTSWRILRRNPRALLGFVILLGFGLMATIGPYLIKLDEDQNFAERFQAPSLSHLMGTDYVGRDVFAQIIYGSRDVLIVAVLAAILTILIGVFIGAISGLAGGPLDTTLMMLVNVILTVPSFPLMLIIASMFKVTNPISYALLLAIWSWGGLARAVRSQILSLKKREFIEAARVLGLPAGHIIFRQLLPNITPYLAINFISIMRHAITASVGIMMLGLVPYSSSNWGMMLNLAVFQSGAVYTPSAIFYLLAPITAICLFQLGGIFFAHGLDELMNPRLRS
ncbi:MAG: binding-protein-dependent transport system inner rane component [Symbiobacteriaceae bacterium]|jgi:peptide/nickel transport system permease protein|nr:binding-protein-dependent transport system inner rane component [Symbiobacteriaceae bacterium]